MTRVHLTGFSVPAFGLQWEYAESDKDVARAAVIFLEDRRLLFGDHHMEDEIDCLRSAMEIRSRLTALIPAARQGGGVEQSLRLIRAACAQFVSKAGHDARNFRGFYAGGGVNLFALALGELRALVGIQLAQLVVKYNLEVEEDLLSIFPSTNQDVSWLPGFGGGRSDCTDPLFP